MVDLKHLPLFPLPVVLFPQSRVPIHIYEDRYKKMAAECLERGAEFGINFVEGTTMFPTGCTARIDEVLKKYDDGRMDVVVQGVRRFMLESYTKTEEKYLAGQAHEVNEIPDRPDRADVLRAIEMFNEVVEVALRPDVEPLNVDEWIDNDKEFVSYRIAQKCGLEPAARQELLEIRSERERIAMLIDHLVELLPRLREQADQEVIIRNDGYIQEKGS